MGMVFWFMDQSILFWSCIGLNTNWTTFAMKFKQQIFCKIITDERLYSLSLLSNAFYSRPLKMVVQRRSIIMNWWLFIVLFDFLSTFEKRSLKTKRNETKQQKKPFIHSNRSSLFALWRKIIWLSCSSLQSPFSTSSNRWSKLWLNSRLSQLLVGQNCDWTPGYLNFSPLNTKTVNCSVDPQ